MPGLVGFVSKKYAGSGLIEAMAKSMLHRVSYRVHVNAVGDFACGTIDLPVDGGIASASSTDGRYTLVFYGALYEDWARKGYVSAVTDGVDAGMTNEPGLAYKLLKRWNQSGAKALYDLNGDYLIVVWDKLEERLTIVNDRLGLRRLNYWSAGDMFAFASEVKALAVIPEVNRAVDEQALSELLTFGHLQDDRTLLRDVKLLPHASCLTWKDGKIEIIRYWDYTFKADPKFQNFDCAVDEYFEVVRQATERRIQGYDRIGLFLSGGLDSRTVGGMIRKVRPDAKLITWTAGHGHDHDSRFGRRIAHAIRSEHHAIRIPENFLEIYGPEYSWVLDGIVSTHGCHRSCLIEEAREQADVVLLGYMGDTVSGGKPLDQVYHLTDMDALTQKGYAHYAVGFDEALFQKTLKPGVFTGIKGAAFESFAATVHRVDVEFPGDRIVYAELVQRQRVYNPPAQMDLQGIDCDWVTPFSDRDFIDFSLRLPMKVRLHKQAYLGMIRKYFPELAGIPRSGEGLSLVHTKLRASLHWRWVLFQRRTLPKLTGGLLGGHNYGAFVHCAERFRRASRAFIERTLIDSPILEEHFQMDQLNALVFDFLNNRSERDMMDCLASLMTYVLFKSRLDQMQIFSERKESICVAS